MKDGMLPRRVAIRLIGRGVWLELLRRQDLYVCGMLMLLFLLGVFAMRLVGIDAPATGTFMLNIGLGLAAIAAHVLLCLLAIRQFPAEIENRTLYPLLARPVRRGDIVAAKWLAVGLCGVIVYVVLGALAWSSVPKLELYDTVLLLQLVILQFLSLFLLAGLAIVLSLLLPRGLALLVGMGLYFGGATLRRIVGQGSGLRQLLAAYIPDFGMLDMTTRYTDGIGALGVVEFGLLLGYGASLLLICLLVAVCLFERRRL